MSCDLLIYRILWGMMCWRHYRIHVEIRRKGKVNVTCGEIDIQMGAKPILKEKLI